MEKIIDIGKRIFNKYGGADIASKHYVKYFNKWIKTKDFEKRKINKKFLKIGNIYYFEYFKKDEMYKLYDSKLPFFDMKPIGLLIDYDKEKGYVKFIDLNIVPYNVKLLLFEILNKRYKYFIEKSENNTVEKWLEFPDVKEYIEKYIRYNIKISYIKYDLKYIKYVYGIDWSKINMLLFMNKEDDVYYNKRNRINKYELYRLYKKNMR